MFAFRVLGGVSLEGKDGPLSGKAVQPRRIALLALLASDPHHVLSRDKLIGFLWPESDADQGRHRLSESLYVLRKALGEGVLISEGDNVRLDPEQVSCDAISFSRALLGGDLEGAVSLYAGPFLDGFFLKNAPEFDRWSESVRKSLADDYGRALEALALDADRNGEHLEAVEWWSRLAIHDPYNSRFALGVMESMARAGDPGNAIHHAQEHTRFLMEELGTEPTPELLAFSETLKKGEMPAQMVGAEEGGIVGEDEGGIVGRIKAEATNRAGPSARGAEVTSKHDSEPEAEPGAGALEMDDTNTRGRRRGWRPGALVLGVAAVGVALVLVGSALLRANGNLSSVPTMLVVLPLENLGEAGDEYIVSGISEEITARLSAVSALGVIGRTTAKGYRGTIKSATEIGGELDVDFVVDGSARLQHRSDGRFIRATIQLIRADDARILWSRTYEELLADILQVESDIAQAVVDELEVRILEPEERSLAAVGTGSIQAYDYYLLGRHYLGLWNPTGIEQATQYLQQAVEVDPSYAQGYAGLAYAFAVLGGWEYLGPERTWPHAREAAETALALHEGLAEAHTALALEAMSHRHDWGAAKEGFERALELNPNSVDAMVWYALLESGIWGRQDVALELISRAERLDPGSRDVQYNLGFLRFQAGDTTGAFAAFDGLMESAPEYFGGFDGLSVILTALGRNEEALEGSSRADELYGSSYDQQIGFVGFLHGRLGQREKALQQLARLDALAHDGKWVSPMARARIYAGLGDADEAMTWLERAWDERSHWLIWLGWEPWYWESLASDPRFHALVDRMDYPSPFARRVLTPNPS